MANLRGIIILTFASCVLEVKTARSPILLIPGFSSSQLETRVTSSQSDCECCTDWTGLWINATRGSTLPTCFLNELTLVYDPATKEYNNTPGVDIRVPGFGETRTVADLVSGATTDNATPNVPYMHGMIRYFVNQGYVSGTTIRAAPFDWRFSAVQLEQRGYYSQLQSLVETMYNDNSERVTIVAHSMGGLVSLYFLNNVVNQEWKDQYINAYIPIAAPFGGTASALGGVILGGESIENAAGGHDSTETVRTWPGLVMLFPSPPVYGDTVLISTPARNYTANDYQELFDAIGYTNGYQMYLGTDDINAGYPAPNVTVHCVVGINIPTPIGLTYPAGNISNASSAVIVNGPGDGLVEDLATGVCLRWRNEQQNFTYQAVPNVNHGALLSDMSVLQDILAIATTRNATDPTTPPPTVINIGAIIGGVVAALIAICALIIFIPILICCLCGVGIGAACGCACCQIRKAAKSSPV